MLRLSLFL
ncbi:hypothetical protein D039_4141, partial [Vibrio parahaemolyticus EKP-028]